MELRFLKKKTKKKNLALFGGRAQCHFCHHIHTALARLMHISSHGGHFFTCTVIDSDHNTRTKALRRIRRGSVLILRLLAQLVFVLVLFLYENV